MDFEQYERRLNEEINRKQAELERVKKENEQKLEEIKKELDNSDEVKQIEVLEETNEKLLESNTNCQKENEKIREMVKKLKINIEKNKENADNAKKVIDSCDNAKQLIKEVSGSIAMDVIQTGLTKTPEEIDKMTFEEFDDQLNKLEETLKLK